MILKKYIKLLLTTSSFIFISGKVISSENNVNQQLFQPNQDISNYYKTHLLPAIQRHFLANNRDLGPLWYNYDDLEASEFARNMGENFYNPRLLLATAGFDPNILNGLPVLNLPQRQSVRNPRIEPISDYYQAHLLPAIQRHFLVNNRDLGPLWYNYDDLEASEFARNMGENFYNPRLLLATAGFDPNILNGLPVLNLPQRQSVRNPRIEPISDYYQAHLLPAIQRHFLVNNRDLGPLWYNYDDLEASEFARNMGENFYNPRLLLATAGFDPNILNGLPEFNVDLINNSVANNQVIANGNNEFNIEALSIETLREILDVMGVVLEEEDRDNIEFLKATLFSLQEDQLNNVRIETARAEAARIAALEAHRLEEDQRLEENRRIETAGRLQAEREAVAVNPVTWVNMTKAQRILVIAEKIFESPNSNIGFDVPIAVDKRIELKNIFEALMADNYINTNAILLPNAEPANFRIHYRLVSNILRKAINIQKYETDYGMTRQEAKDFNTFNSLYQTKFVEFPLTLEKQMTFYRSLKDNFDNMPWENVLKILTPILEKSLPLDYDQWPNFAVNSAATFNRFIRDIIEPCAVAVRGSADVEVAAEAYIENLLLNNQRQLKAKIDGKIAVYQNTNNQYITDELNNHGQKKPFENVKYPIELIQSYLDVVRVPLADAQDHDHYHYNLLVNEAPTLTEWENGIKQQVINLEERSKFVRGSKQRINYSNLCVDPFLCLLRKADEKLIPIRHNYQAHNIEIENLKNLVLGLLPADFRMVDDEFKAIFDPARGERWAFGFDSPKNRNTIMRLKRLFDTVKENHDEVTAAKTLYLYGAENSERCNDGKGGKLTEVERKYVYVSNGLNANDDLDATIGFNLTKLFMDDRVDKLTATIDALYPTELDPEATTYAGFRTNRAIYTGFSLPGSYEEMVFGYGHKEGINPVDFVKKYFEGGQIRGKKSTRVYNIPAFTIDTMTDIVLNQIKIAEGSDFSDGVLNRMIDNNLNMRRAYKEFQDNERDADFENLYFKNATLKQRDAIKKEAIIEVLKTYNYIYTRNSDLDEWE